MKDSVKKKVFAVSEHRRHSGERRRSSVASVAKVAAVVAGKKADKRGSQYSSADLGDDAEEHRRTSVSENAGLRRAFWNDVRSILHKEREKNPPRSGKDFVILTFWAVLKAIRGVTRRAKIITMWQRKDTQEEEKNAEKTEEGTDDVNDDFHVTFSNLSREEAFPQVRALLSQLESLSSVGSEAAQNAKRAAEDLMNRLAILRRLSEANLDFLDDTSSDIFQTCDGVKKSIDLLKRWLQEVPDGPEKALLKKTAMELESFASELSANASEQDPTRLKSRLRCVLAKLHLAVDSKVVDMKNVKPKSLYRALRSDTPDHLLEDIEDTHDDQGNPPSTTCVGQQQHELKGENSDDIFQHGLQELHGETNATIEATLSDQMKSDAIDEVLSSSRLSHEMQDVGNLIGDFGDSPSAMDHADPKHPHGSKISPSESLNDALKQVVGNILGNNGLEESSLSLVTPNNQSQGKAFDKETPEKEVLLPLESRNLAAANYVRRVSQTSDLLQNFDSDTTVEIPDWVKRSIVEGAMRSPEYAETMQPDRNQNQDVLEATTTGQFSNAKFKRILKERVTRGADVMPKLDLQPRHFCEHEFDIVRPQLLGGSDGIENRHIHAIRRNDEGTRSDDSSLRKETPKTKSEERRKAPWVSTLVHRVHDQHRVERSRVTVEAVCVARAMTQRELDRKHNYLPGYARSQTENHLPPLVAQDSKSFASPKRFEAALDIPAPNSARPTVVRKIGERFAVPQVYNPPSFGPGPGQSWSARLPGGAGLSFLM